MSARLKGAGDWLAGGAIGAAIFAWFGHAFLNYDTFYALLWGGDLAHGRTPDYSVAVAPTPHPLAELIGMPLSLFGAAGEDLMLAAGLLGLGMLVVGCFRLGQELFGVWAGVAAAAIVATRVPFLNFGIRGYVDLATAAFVVWAAVLEVRRPRRGAPVLILLGLAGLLRPEAWLYAAGYWLWLAFSVPRDEGVTPLQAGDEQSVTEALQDRPSAAREGVTPLHVGDERSVTDLRRRAVRLLPLALAAPAIWLVSDLVITGDALHSLTGTHDLAAQLGRKTGLTSVPEVAPRRLGEILRLPELVAAVAGLVLAFVWMRRRVALPVAIAALNAIAYTAFGVARLPLLGRYLFVAASMIAVLAGAGLLGWLALPREHGGRRPWMAVGLAALTAVVVFFPLQQVDRLDTLEDDIAARDRIQADLHRLVDQPGVRDRLRACARVYVPSHRPIPLVSYWADIRTDRIRTPAPGERVRGCVIAPADAQVARLAILDPNEPATAGPPLRAHVSARNRSWLFARRGTITGD